MNDQLRWKISSILAAKSNHEFVDLLFASVPQENLEELVRRDKTVYNSSIFLDRSRR